MKDVYVYEDYKGEFNLLLMEKATIEKALKRTKGNQKKASELLQITERTLYTKIKRHQIKIKPLLV